MDCQAFSNWIENRDMYDVSEADKALKHTVQCIDCKRKLQLDEQLDDLLAEAMKPVTMPASLADKVELNLDRMTEKKAATKYGWYGAVSAVLTVVVIAFLYFPFSSGIPSIDELGKHVIADHGGHDDTVLVVSKPDDLYKLGSLAASYDAVKTQLPEGYTFVGARICPLGDCKAVHMVFTEKDKRISLYLVKTDDVDFSLSADRKYSMTMGDQVVNFWKRGAYIYAMVV